MSFLIDDKQFNFIEDKNIVYSVFLDSKNVYPMWFNEKENLFYFMVNVAKERKRTCVAFPQTMWAKLKTHFDMRSQTIVEDFIVSRQ